MSFVGVDGCPGGWIAVVLDRDAPPEARHHEAFADVWQAHREAEAILVDAPIGLREDSAEPRPCDRAARERLGRPRAASVFTPPIRPALDAGDYAEARSIQEARTSKSLGAQAWGIADAIREVDELLRGEPVARHLVREAHPEVCWWALNGQEATRWSKTGQPVAAFFERVGVLETVHADPLGELRRIGEDLASSAGLDDLVDAFVLAATAGPWTGPLRSLPADPERGEEDPRGLGMRIHYARPRGSEDDE